MENQGIPNPSADDLLREANSLNTNTNTSGFKTKSIITPPQGPTKPLGVGDYNSRFSEIASIKVDPLRFSKPSQFGAGTEGFHLDRYYAHPDANILGINPANFNTEQYYNEKGSIGGDFIRMAKYLPSTAWGFTKDYLEPWTNPSSLFDTTPDLDAAHNYHHNMGIMMSSKDGFAGSSVNFFANLAPTIGITAGVAIERAGLFAGQAIGSKIPGVKTVLGKLGSTASAKTAMQLPNLIERAKSIKSSISAFRQMESAAKLKAVWSTTKGLGKSFVQELNPVKNTVNAFNDAEHLTALAQLNKTFGGFFKDVQRARFAISEAQVEGGGAVLEKIDSGRQEYAATQQKEINRITKELQGLVDEGNNITDQAKYSQLYGELNIAKQKLASGPTPEEASKILTIAEQNGKAVTLLNLPIIYATNAFGFEKLIGHGTVKRTLAQEFVARYNKHLVRSTMAGAAGKASYQLLNNNIKKWGSKAYWKHALGQAPSGVLDYLGKNVPEGIQELFQEGALVGVDHYYTTKFNDPYKFHKSLLGESALVGANSQFSKQGLEVFMQGTLGGAAMWSGTTLAKSIASPILELGKKTWYGKENYDKYAAELEAEANRVLTAAQKVADDPEQFYALFDKAAGEQTNFARVGQVAEALGDEKAQRDIRNDATISYVHTLAQAGRLDVVADELKAMRELSAEDLANAMGEDYVEADQAKYFDRLERSINKVEDLGERFKKARELMPNKYNPSSVNKNLEPDKYRAEVTNYQAHEEAVFFSVYATKTFEETLDRLQGIQEKFSAIPSFSKIPGMNAAKIFSVSQMQDDVESLRTRAKILEESGDKSLAAKLNKQANDLENLANASAVFSTLSNLAGKTNLTPEETKELEQARKTYMENLAKTNEENETEYTIEDLTSQDALDEYERELKKAFDAYFNGQTTSNNVRPFLNEELADMFTLYKDWHAVGSDNRAMAKWVNMLTDPEGFNAFRNNISVTLTNVYNKRNTILREQKKKFMKGAIQNAFIQKLFDEAKVYVDVEDLEAFARNSRYPKLIDAKTNKPLKSNDPRIPMIEEMFDNYEKTYNKVVTERPIREASAQLDALEELFNLAHKPKNKEDKRSLVDYAKELGIDPYRGGVVSVDAVVDFIINSKFATSAERKLAQKIKSLNTGMKITFKTNHSAPVTYDGKNGIIVDLRYASPKYDRGSNRAEYLILKGMMMSMTTDFLDDKAFADEVEEMMTAVVAAAQADPSLVGGKIPFGLSSPQAFISEVMTNPEFQALLAKVKSTRDPKSSTFNDIIKAITKYIKNVFKINNASDTVLRQATGLVGLTIDQSDYLQEPGKRRAPSPAEEALSEEPDELLEEVAIDNAEDELAAAATNPGNLTPEELERYEKLLKAEIKAIQDALKSGLGVTPLAVFVDGSLIPFDEASAEIEALKKKKNGEKTEETNDEKVAKLRAKEQEDLRNAIPDIDSYRDGEGNVDKSKLTGMKLALYEQIYAKYDKLISPLLGIKPATETTTAEVTTEEIPEVLPVEETPAEEVPAAEVVVEEPSTEDEIDSINTNTPAEELPKDLYDLLYDEYKKTIKIAKIKESKTGFVSFMSTNQKAAKVINKWKEDKKAGLKPAEKEEEVDKPLNLAEVRQAVLDRGWLPEDINGFSDDALINIYNSGVTRDQALQLPDQSAEFVDADLKVAKFIETLKKNLKSNDVEKVEGKGYTKNGNPLPRVSDIVKDILQKEFKKANAANRGNVLDPIFREFFDGKILSVQDVKTRLEELSNVVDPDTGEKMMAYSATFPTDLLNTLREVKQYLNNKGLKVIGGIPTLYGNIGGPRSGEIDFLVYDKNGQIGIVDLKTSTFNLKERYDDPADELQYKRSHTIQQLAYRELIRQATGEDIKSIYILPIELSFDGKSNVVKRANTINTGTPEAPSMLLQLNTSRDIFEVTGIGRPVGVAEPVRTEEEQKLLNEQEQAEQLRRIEALKAKLDKLKGQQIAALQAKNIGRATDLIEKITKITDELKLYGIDVSQASLEVPTTTEEVVEQVKPEVGMILKLADGKLVKIKKITKKEISVVPLNDEDAEGQVLDADTVEGIENMVVSPTSKKEAPAPTPETEEVMNESKSNAETLANDKDAQAKLASEAEKMSADEAQNNFLKNLNNRCE